MTPQERIESVLQDDSTYSTYRELLSQAGIEQGNASLLSVLVRSVVEGDLPPGEFVRMVAEEFRVPFKVSQGIIDGIVERVLTPIQADLPVPLSEFRSKTPKVPIETDFSKEEAEASRIAQEKAHIVEAQGPLDVGAIVEEICEHPSFKFDDPTLKERCVKLIESRVRDVRTPEQTRLQLEKSIETGGLGVTGRRLSDMLALIEGKVAAYQGNLAQEEARKRDEVSLSVPSKEELAKKEEALLTKKYIELTGKVPGSHVAPAAPSVSRTSVAIAAHHEQQVREGKIDTGKVKEAIQNAKEAAQPPRPKLSPSMQEVTFEKRLSGPIDELRSLTLTDFRRLSKDSAQAATKVKDKAELLEEQGYEKKVEAIQAWRASPLNQLYVALTREALLSGTSVSELLSRKRTAGEETFTDEELKAVMSINAELRF